MAVSDELLVKVSVDTKAATAGISDLNKDLKNLSVALADAAKAGNMDALVSEAQKFLSANTQIMAALDRRGKTQLDIAREQRSATDTHIASITDALQKEGKLTEELNRQFMATKALAAAQEGATISEAQIAASEKLAKQIDAMNTSLKVQQATEEQLAFLKADKSNKELAALADSLKAQGLLNDELERQIVTARSAIEAQLNYDLAAAQQQDAAKAAETTTEALGAQSSVSKVAAASMVVLNQALELAAKAYRAIVGPIEDAIAAFVESDKVQTTLIYTLKAVGIEANAAFADLQGFASGLQATTTTSDETVLSLSSMAKVMGLSNKQTKEVVKAALDMSTVLGTDVNTAFNELLGQFSGVTGRSAKFVVGLKDLTEAQLKTGKGIELVTKQFGGFAEIQSKTLAGAMQQSKVAFGDIYEETGKVISQLFDLPGAAASTKETFIAISEGVKEFGARLVEIKEVLATLNWAEIGKTVGIATAAFGAFFLVLNGPAIASAAAALYTLAAPLILIAAKVVIVSGAIIALVAAIDIVVRNFDRLGDLSAIATAAIILGFRKVSDFVGKVGDFIVEKMQAAFEFIGNLFSAENIKNVLSGTSSVGEVISKAFGDAFAGIQSELGKTDAELLADIKSKADGLDFGLAGEGIKLVNGLLADTEKKAESVNKTFNDTSRITAEGLKPTKEQLALVQQLKLENMALQNAVNAASQGRAATMQDEIRLLEAQSAEKLRQLELDGKLAGETGKQILAGLKEQLALQIAKLAPVKEQLDLAKQLAASNDALQLSADAAGQTVIETLDAQYALLVKQNEEKLTQLELDGMLGGEAGAKIVAGLEKQLELQREINDQKIFDEAEKKIEKMNPVAAAVGTTALDAGKSFNAVVLPAFNSAFGTNIQKFSASSIASFAIGAGEFFNSFEGFMAGSAKILGGGLTLAASGLDAILGTSFADGASAFGDALAGVAGAIGGVIDGMVSGIAKFFDPKFIQGLADTLAGLVEEFPQMLMKAFEALADAMDKVIAKLPEIIEQLMNSLSGILDRLISSAPKLIDALADALVKFLDKLPELTGKLFAALPGLVDKLFSKLPAIIDSLFQAIPKIITQIIQAIPGVLKGIMDNLPAILESLITGILGAMGEIVAAFIDFLIGGGLEQIVGAFLRMIPKLVVAFVKGVVNGLVRAFGAIFGGIKAPEFIKDAGELPKKFEKGIKDLSKGVAKEASKVFKVLDLESEAAAIDRIKDAGKVTDVIEAAAEVVGKRVKGIWEAFLSALRKVWEWVAGLLTPLWNALKAVWQAVYDYILKPFLSLLSATWDALKAIWQGVYDNILKPFLSVLKTVWDGVMILLNAWVNLLKAAWNVVTTALSAWLEVLKSVWSGLMLVLTATWDAVTGVLKAAWDGIISIFKSVWDGIKVIWQTLMDLFQGKIGFLEAAGKIWGAMFDTAKVALNAVAETFKAYFDGLKDIFDKAVTAFKDTFKAFTDGAKKIGTSIWDGLNEGLANASALFKGYGTDVWNSLKTGLGGIGAKIKEQLDAVNPLNLFTKMFNFNDTSGEGTVERTLGIKIPYANFAKGGVVPGSALVAGDSAMNDRVVAMLSPGEAVIPRSKMDNPAIRALVDSIVSGSFSPPKYFLGIGGSSGGIGISNPFDGGGNPLGPVFDGLSDAAKGAFGPIAGTVGSILDPTQLKKLGDAITNGSVNLKTSPLGDIAKAGDVALGQAREIGKAAGNTVSGIGAATIKASEKAVKDAIKGAKTAAQKVQMLAKYADPRYLWNLAKEKAFGSVIDGMANHEAYHTGGLVKGYANGGDVMATLQPGEFVMQRGAVNRLGTSMLNGLNNGGSGSGSGSTVVNMDIKVSIDASSQSLDETYVRSKLLPAIKEEFKKASLRGDFLLSERGIRVTA